jgi:hypothetical protein
LGPLSDGMPTSTIGMLKAERLFSNQHRTDGYSNRRVPRACRESFDWT